MEWASLLETQNFRSADGNSVYESKQNSLFDFDK